MQGFAVKTCQCTEGPWAFLIHTECLVQCCQSENLLLIDIKLLLADFVTIVVTVVKWKVCYNFVHLSVSILCS